MTSKHFNCHTVLTTYTQNVEITTGKHVACLCNYEVTICIQKFIVLIATSKSSDSYKILHKHRKYAKASKTSVFLMRLKCYELLGAIVFVKHQTELAKEKTK